MPCQRRRRAALVTFTLVAGISAPAFAQAPATGPLILHVPSSARTAALANAWVAGRDQDVIFHNPAQLIGTRSGVDLSITRLGPASSMTSISSVFAAGKWSATFGWGAQLLGFNGNAATGYPFSPDILLADGPRNGTDALLAAGGAIVFKGFRVGATVKFVSEMAIAAPAALLPVRVNQHRLLADVGVARNLFGGAAALAVQNIGGDSTRDGTRLIVPRQIALGWSRTRQAGPLDLALFTQVSRRKGWTTPAAGLEVGYSWLEGYAATFRIGARRAETDAEKPLSLGAALSADRLTLEYAVRFFDGGRTANGVTIRWR
jgi:hypothetical protein